MCSGSPAVLSTSRSAPTAGTHLLEPGKGVNPGRVAVAPVYAEAVGTHERQRYRVYVGGYGQWIEQRAAAHFLHAAGAGAGETQEASRKKSLMALIVPFNEEAVIATGDSVGDRQHGIRAGSLGSWKHKDPPKIEGSLAPSSELCQATRSRNRSPVSPSRKRRSARSLSCRMRSRVTPIIRPISSRVRLLPSSSPK
jgi:hypothetical protein